MKFLHASLILVLIYVACVGVTDALPRTIRQVEVVEGDTEQRGEVKEQLLMAFDSFKKSIEEFTSKINTEEIVNGVQNLTATLQSYAKKTADQLASTASAIGNTQDKTE